MTSPQCSLKCRSSKGNQDSLKTKRKNQIQAIETDYVTNLYRDLCIPARGKVEAHFIFSYGKVIFLKGD